MNRISVVRKIDPDTGRILKTLDTSILTGHDCMVFSLHNLFFIVEYSFNTYLNVHKYKNDVYKETITLQIRFENKQWCSVVCGGDYLLLLTGENKIAVVDLDSSRKNETKYITIQLNKKRNIFSLVWVPRDDENSGNGYLFVSYILENPYHIFESQIFELNLFTNTSSIMPLQIPFMETDASKIMYFTCAMGTDAMLCREAIKTPDKTIETVTILKLEKILE